MNDETKRLAQEIFVREISSGDMLKAGVRGSKRDFEVQIEHVDRVAKCAIQIARGFERALEEALEGEARGAKSIPPQPKKEVRFEASDEDARVCRNCGKYPARHGDEMRCAS